MAPRTALTERLGLSTPVIQAPMAGGGDTPGLVAAVCEAGGLGSIGAAYLSPTQIAETAREVRERTRKPFGINLFVPLPAPEPPADPQPALDRLAPYFAELGLPAPALPTVPNYAFDEQFAACLDSGAAVFSFALGLLPPDAMAEAKARGFFVMGTATTPEEAVALERSGVDAVVAQGSEAGGHRGTFIGGFGSGMIGTLALVPQVADAVAAPVVASGGIMDGRGIAAALALGAAAAQMGTAFLTCAEAGAADAYKQAILDAGPADTRLTRAFSGRPARGIENRLMREIEPAGAFTDKDAILPFPLQNVVTRSLRAAAAKAGRAEFLSLWAGQGLGLARRGSAAELMARLAAETEAALRRVGSGEANAYRP